MQCREERLLQIRRKQKILDKRFHYIGQRLENIKNDGALTNPITCEANEFLKSAIAIIKTHRSTSDILAK